MRHPGTRRSSALATVGLALLATACGTAPGPVSTAASTAPASAEERSLHRPSETAGPSSPAPASPACDAVARPRLPWWNDRVFYEVFVRSYRDSDADGIGDLRGLTDRLDYLNDGDPATTDDLGVTGLWLMPVAESPSYHGYDVTDYRAVERDYGTAEDFHALVDAAHQRGIAVIVDLVLNHTSREHPWFVDARTAGSDRESWYLWADQRPRGVVRPGGERVWHEADGRFYYGYFWEGMPDLNLAHPDVTAELDAVARFWLEEMGVDGFRLDAIKHLFEDGRELEDVPESRVWLEGFQDRLEAVDPDVLLVGEAYDVTSASAAYVPASVDMTFDFGFASSILVGLRGGGAPVVRAALEESLEAYPPGQRAVFLTNHDQPRVMTELGRSEEAARAAAALLLTSPGVPFLYYGEEIGMTGTKPDERIRTPMAWDASSPAAGFSDAVPWQPLSDGWPEANVDTQSRDPDSLLAWYRSLIRLRAAEPALAGTPTAVLDTSHDAVLAVLRGAADEGVLVLVNLSDEPVSGATVDLGAGGACAARARVLLGDAAVSDPTADPAAWSPVRELRPHESIVIKLSR